MRPSHRPARSSRLAGVFGAILLQGGFFLALIAAMPHFPARPALQHELTWLLPQLQKVQPLPGRTLSLPGAITVTPKIEPPARLVPPLAAAPAVPLPSLQGFGQALNGCAPENFTTLDEAQRSRCRKLSALPSYDPSAVDYGDHSNRVAGAKQWELELARKKAPLLLPCGNPKAVNLINTGACIIANIANGFTFQKQYENQPVYSDNSGKK